VRRDQQVTELADAFVTGEPMTGPVREIAVLEGLRSKAEDISKDFREWWIRVFQGAKDKLQALADKGVDRAVLGRPARPELVGPAVPIFFRFPTRNRGNPRIITQLAAAKASLSHYFPQ
jgi:hypothetical protein